MLSQVYQQQLDLINKVHATAANDLGVTIMKLLALTLGLLPLMAMAGQTINEQIDVPANKRIFIENQRGDVRIEGWDKPHKIEGELDDKAQGYRLEVEGSRVEFIVKCREI